MTDAPTRTTTHARTGEQSVMHRRTFDAPAALVQRAHVEADLFQQWTGPVGTSVRLDRFEAVTGGAFRYAVVAGAEAWTFFGSYHEVLPGRIVHTWQFEGDPDYTLETIEFRDLDDGGSVLETTSVYRSAEACTAMLESGLDAGMDENFDRLDGLLPTL